MPRIDPAEVRRIARLARLRLTEGEVDRLADELGEVLTHFDALREGEGDAPREADPLQPDRPSPLREDEPGPDPLRRPPARGAPSWSDGFFLVPRPPGLDDPP